MSLIDQIAAELANVPPTLIVGPRNALAVASSVSPGAAGTIGLTGAVPLTPNLGITDGIYWEQLSGRMSSTITQAGTLQGIGAFIVDAGSNVILELGQATVTTLGVASQGSATQSTFVVYPPLKLTLVRDLLQLRPGLVQPFQAQLQMTVNAAAASTITVVFDVIWRVVQGTSE